MATPEAEEIFEIGDRVQIITIAAVAPTTHIDGLVPANIRGNKSRWVHESQIGDDMHEGIVVYPTAVGNVIGYGPDEMGESVVIVSLDNNKGWCAMRPAALQRIIRRGTEVTVAWNDSEMFQSWHTGLERLGEEFTAEYRLDLVPHTSVSRGHLAQMEGCKRHPRYRTQFVWLARLAGEESDGDLAAMFHAEDVRHFDFDSGRRSTAVRGVPDSPHFMPSDDADALEEKRTRFELPDAVAGNDDGPQQPDQQQQLGGQESGEASGGVSPPPKSSRPNTPGPEVETLSVDLFPGYKVQGFGSGRFLGSFMGEDVVVMDVLARLADVGALAEEQKTAVFHPIVGERYRGREFV